VTAISLSCWSGSDQKAIREQLVRILNSGPFHQSQRRQRFLEYLVNETLAGRSERLKAYNVALEVFERPETFDPITDPDAKGLLHGSRVPSMISAPTRALAIWVTGSPKTSLRRSCASLTWRLSPAVPHSLTRARLLISGRSAENWASATWSKAAYGRTATRFESYLR
jgi:hypothetical protein